jgi:hypothetical protein
MLVIVTSIIGAAMAPAMLFAGLRQTTASNTFGKWRYHYTPATCYTMSKIWDANQTDTKEYAID